MSATALPTGDCVEANRTVTCGLGNLASGDVATVTIVVTTTVAGSRTHTNTASVASLTPDSDNSNNSASTTNFSTVPTPVTPVPSVTEWGLVGMAVVFAALLMFGLTFKSRLRPRAGGRH